MLNEFLLSITLEKYFIYILEAKVKELLAITHKNHCLKCITVMHKCFLYLQNSIIMFNSTFIVQDQNKISEGKLGR